jgi:protein involved in polysaccharide export with SLBB domain
MALVAKRRAHGTAQGDGAAGPGAEGAAVAAPAAGALAGVLARNQGGAGAPALAGAAASPTAPELQATAQCDPAAGAVDIAVLGDRLALRFFEHSELAAAPSADGTPTSESIVFERLDLSGSYEVGANGAVSLPAIGHVDVIGRSLSCIEALVTLAANERLRLDGSVSAAFASRPPVLVRGMVRAPGAHAYLPGLTVERVLVQAGAMEGIETLSPLQLAGLRAREHELDALDASLIIERARIDVAIEGDVDFAADAEAWDAAADAIGASPTRVYTERDVLLSEIAEENAHKQRASGRIEDLAGRISAARQHLQVLEKHLGYVSERHERLAARLQQGVTTENKLEEAMDRVMVMERTILERREALLQLESELRLARNEAVLREAERRKRLALAARDAVKERAVVREQLHTVRAQLSVQSRGDGQTLTVTIERQEPDGVKRFAAAPGTSVRPGDLVSVAAGDGGGAHGEMLLTDGGSGLPGDQAIPASWR